MNRYLKIILSIVVLSLVVGYVIFISRKADSLTDELVCKNIKYTITPLGSNRLITSKEIAIVLEKNNLNPIGRGERDISTNNIEKLLRGNEMIKKVEVFKAPDGTVIIEILQRTPLFRVLGKDDFIVDTDKTIMPIPKTHVCYLPLVTGRVDKQQALNEMNDLMVFLSKDKFWKNQIAQVYVQPNGEVELIPRVGSHNILLGRVQGFETKLKKMNIFYNKVLKNVGWGLYSTINLKYKNQVVCTKR